MSRKRTGGRGDDEAPCAAGVRHAQAHLPLRHGRASQAGAMVRQRLRSQRN